MKERDAKDLWFMIGTTAAVYCGIRFLLPLFVPFLFSYFLAKLFYPIVYKAKKRFHISGTLSISILIGALLGVLGGGIFWLGKALLKQLQNFIQLLPVYEQWIMGQLNRFCGFCDETFQMKQGTSLLYVNHNMGEWMGHIKEEAMSLLSLEALIEAGKVLGAGWAVFVVLWGAVLIVKDMEELRIIYEESFLYRHGKKIFQGLSEIGMAYGKSQLIIMSIVFIICTLAFFLIGSSYGLLLGFIVSIFDAFPILGSGMVFIPWTIAEVVKGEWYHGAVLFSAFVLCQIVHELVEEKIIGGQIGVKPIFTIMSMYAGVKLFGIFGFILGPIALMIIKISLQSQY